MKITSYEAMVKLVEALGYEVEIVPDYDDALNSAGWTLLEEIQKHQEVDGPLFNNLKECLRQSLITYLNHKENK